MLSKMIDNLSSLRDELKRQKNLILNLQQQLRSVLLILGINEHNIQPVAKDQHVREQSEQNSNVGTDELNVADLADHSAWEEVAASTKGPHCC
jgi:hypothetical protein